MPTVNNVVLLTVNNVVVPTVNNGVLPTVNNVVLATVNNVVLHPVRAGLRLWGARGHIFVGGPGPHFFGVLFQFQSLLQITI